MSVPLLEARDLGFRVDGRQLLDRLNVSVHPGDRLALVGPSGSGKTTLLCLLAGLLRPSAGVVSLDGVALSRPARSAAGVAFVLQGYGLVALLTAQENVEIALRAAGQPPLAAQEAALAALNDLGLLPHADQLVQTLSGGQQQRTAIARALAVRPRLLLADEPTAELDPAARALALDRMLAVADAGGAVVLATHDPQVAERCDRTLDLHPA